MYCILQPWWHVYTGEWCSCILTVSHICQGVFPLPALQFSSSWVSFLLWYVLPNCRGFPLTSLSLASRQLRMQYGSRLFSETGCSYNSAVDWDNFTKFGTCRDPDLLRTCALPIRNRKLIRAVNGRHLENFSDVIITPPMAWFTWNLVCRRRCWWWSAG